ncbi:MAG: hypothetical protein KAJ10_01650 [Thermodesulfovibrionia bacterium]|nr:hypothetical protein [Thermodesulfovibrionia bacterium]
MSVLMRRIILCVIGLLAGLASWPALETLLMTQSSFPSLLVFSVFIGIIFGVFMGGFFGSGEGIIISVKKKLVSGIATGAVIGIVGGTVGFLVGQAALFFTGEYLVHSSRNFNTFGFPVSRAVGWAFLGIFIGMVEGVRAGSFDKIKVGMAGGLAGGFIGGLGLEYFRLLLPDIMLARLLGLLIFGGFIGFFYGLLEDRMSFGVLRVLNGRLRGKEFLVNQRRLRIGGSDKNDIRLDDYQDIADFHTELRVNRKKGDFDVVLKNLDTQAPAAVNDDRIDEHILKFNDVIKIGTVKMMYKF